MAFCKYDSTLKVKHKINPCLFGTFDLPFDQILVTTEDLCVSHLYEELHVSRPDKIKYLSFNF